MCIGEEDELFYRVYRAACIDNKKYLNQNKAQHKSKARRWNSLKCEDDPETFVHNGNLPGSRRALNSNHTRCPWHPHYVNYIDWTDVGHLKKIDLHMKKASNRCSYLHPRNLKHVVFPGWAAGRTPLILACEAGNLDVVRHVVERWGADVNKPSAFEVSIATLTKAYPLFVASALGYPDIVQYLIEKGANVSARTEVLCKSFQVTAMHAATLVKMTKRNRASVIEVLAEYGANPSAKTFKGTPMWRLIGDDMFCMKQFIKVGMSLNQRDPSNGRTMLHHFVSRERESNYLAVIKLMLQKGVNLRKVDRDGLTPLQLAAIGVEGCTNIPAMELLLDHEDISVEEKISALELVGSVLISTSDEWGEGREDGINYWRQAMILRETHHIPKTPLIVTPEVKEFTNMAELQTLQSNKFQRTLQSFLVRQRILSQISFRAVMNHQWPLVISYLSYSQWERSGTDFEVCWMMLQWTRAFVTHKFALTVVEYIISHLSKGLQLCKYSSVLIYNHRQACNEKKLVTTLEMLSQAYRRNPASWFKSEKLLAPIKKNKYFNNERSLASVIREAIRFVPGEDLKVLIEFIQRLPRQDKHEMLHTACSLMHDPPKVHTLVELLLQIGADPTNAFDKQGNSPLHVLVNEAIVCKKDALELSPSAERLIEAGVHVDWVNKEGKTAVDIFKKHYGDNVRASWMNPGVLPLSCLCARYVSPESPDFQYLPSSLRSLVIHHQ